MPGSTINYYNCIICSKRTKAHERRGISTAVKKVLRKNFLLDSFKDSDVICNKCRHLCRKNFVQPQVTAQIQKPHQNEVNTKPQFSPPSITLPIPSTSKSHAYCCICKFKISSNFTAMQNRCLCWSKCYASSWKQMLFTTCARWVFDRGCSKIVAANRLCPRQPFLHHRNATTHTRAVLEEWKMQTWFWQFGQFKWEWLPLFSRHWQAALQWTE